MYLISIYFDEQSNHRISSYMKRIAEETDNDFMIAGQVPPHVTISSFDAKTEEDAKAVLERVKAALERVNTVSERAKAEYGEVFFASVGSFVSGALFLSPVLNQYLQNLQELFYESLKKAPTLKISRQYRPYSWFPHATLAKKLTDEQMIDAFSAMQKEFEPFHAKVVSIGLAKTNPYRDIAKI